jgi:hypothetical protein
MSTNADVEETRGAEEVLESAKTEAQDLEKLLAEVDELLAECAAPTATT